jgi:hypothetical protein
MPLRSRAFSDLRFSPPKRHPGTILRSAPAAPAPPPGEGRRAPSVVSGGGKAMEYCQEVLKRLSAVHLALHK